MCDVDGSSVYDFIDWGFMGMGSRYTYARKMNVADGICCRMERDFHEGDLHIKVCRGEP